jgi:hypothetical protein
VALYGVKYDVFLALVTSANSGSLATWLYSASLTSQKIG